MPEWPGQVGLHRLEAVDSTNAEAFRQAAKGATGPLWITAARQAAGRGRSGRQWASDTGNLYASLLFAPRAPASSLHQLAFVAGVAAHAAIVDATAGVARVDARGLKLKWPNDLLFDGAKLGGILTEATTVRGRAVAAIGIGINILHAPAISGRETTSLDAIGMATGRERLLLHLAVAVDHWLAIWHEGAGFARIRSDWMARGPAIGQPLVVSDNGPLGQGSAGNGRQGRFGGLDDDGALLLVDEVGTTSRVTYGDVTLGWTSVT